MFLNPIFRYLKAKKVDEIKANAKHNEELANQLNLYKKQVKPIDLAIEDNIEFKTCHLY